MEKEKPSQEKDFTGFSERDLSIAAEKRMGDLQKQPKQFVLIPPNQTRSIKKKKIRITKNLWELAK